MKPVLMIHKIDERMFDLPLEEYVLTFDDGTADHYEYWPRIQAIDTEKIYFVTASFVGREGYLTVPQLVEMMQHPQTTIGGHSYRHARLDMHLKFLLDYIDWDTAQMVEWFEQHLNFRPDTFCFPYNDDPHGMYSTRLMSAGFVKFYGRERVPVERLLDA